MQNSTFEEALSFLQDRMGRREFLRQTAVGAILCSSAPLLSGCGSYPKVEASLQVFTAKEFHILHAIMDTFLPVTRKEELSVLEVGAIEYFDSLMAKAPEEMRRNFKILLLIVEHGTFFLGGPWGRFTRLSPERRAEFFHGLMMSKEEFHKIVYTAFMKISMAMYYEHSETWDLFDYPGPLKSRNGAPPPIGNSTLQNLHPTQAAPGPLRIEKGR